MSPTLQRPALLSRLIGTCIALVLGTAAYAGGPPCTQGPANCQLPDIENFPGGTILTSASTQDNFVPTISGNVTSVCWWGAYIEGLEPGQEPFDCGPGPGDNFTITYYTNNPGCPTGAPSDVIASFKVVAAKAATGLEFLLAGFNDPVAEYEFSANHPAVPVIAGNCYWIEVSNVTGADCTFFWEVSPLGVGDGSVSNNVSVAFEMAWCIDLGLDPDTSICVLPIKPSCEGAKGDCGGPNETPGCEDECCCTLVCNSDPICCFDPWDQSCADLAIGLGCAIAPPCQDEVNCQVFDTAVAINSTGLDIFISADDFTPLANGNVADICWYGDYSAGAPTDDFTVRYYDDVNGLPGAVIAQFSQAGGTLPGLTREPTGGIFVYSVTHAPVPVDAGVCYWLEITNPNDGSGDISWFWSVAQDGQGNGRSLLDGHGDPKNEPPDGYFASDARETDLSFCLGLELSTPACGLELLFDTGSHETVLFNGDPSHLGWSSGNLDNGADSQRRTVQAFTVPAVPEGGSVWNIDQLVIEGFLVDGTQNDFLNYEIFTRVALDQAPGPDDSVATGQIAPFPHVYGVTETAAIHIDAGLQLSPGDYWLTMWSSNITEGPFVASNFAWFTNAPDGINNFCTLDAPPPAPGFTGCQGNDPNGDPPGSPMMLRARLYPDPGYGAYTLDPSVLDVDPVNDPTPDPDDLYNAAFRVRGTAGGGVPCPWDLDGGGFVGVGDLLIMLANWNNPYGIGDLLALLAAWGACP